LNPFTRSSTFIFGLFLLALMAGPMDALAENTPCHNCAHTGLKDLSAFDDVDASFTEKNGRMPIGRYPIVDGTHLGLLVFHEFFSWAFAFLLLWQWLNRKRENWAFGSAGHVRVGRIATRVFMPLGVGAGLLMVVNRLQYDGHINNNFPNPLLARLITLYGLSFLACWSQALLTKWIFRGTAAIGCIFCLHLINIGLLIETYRWMITELATNPDEASKEWKICAEMCFIASAFFLWELSNLYVLVKHTHRKAGTLVVRGLDWVRHHRLNMTYITILTLFAPNLFFIHDTYWLFTEENGFSEHGIVWWGRMLWLLVPSVLIFLPQSMFFVAHLRAARGLESRG